MKVLNLLKYFPPYPGGIENIACDIVEELTKRGVSETVISHGKKGYKKNKNIKQILAASYGELLYAPISPSFPIKLIKEIQDEDYDLIHIHVPNVSAFWPLLLRVEIPFVVHWHADVVFPESKIICNAAYKIYSKFERALLKKASAIVATSEMYLQHSLPLKEFKEKCTVIPLGLDFSRMSHISREVKAQTRNLWMDPSSSFLIVAAGRFAHYKGFKYLIEAASTLKNVTVVIAGEGEMRGELKRLVKSLQLDNIVKLPGKISDYELHSLMASCDAFCLPSIERSEAFGVVLLEAMFYEKPLITTKIAGSATSWVNQEGVTGLTVPTEDSVALVQAINALVKYEEMRLKMGIASRKRIEDCFNITKTADSFYQLYCKLL